jgi:hypothetical protein
LDHGHTPLPAQPFDDAQGVLDVGHRWADDGDGDGDGIVVDNEDPDGDQDPAGDDDERPL